MDENMKLRPCPFCGKNAKLMVCDGAGCYYSNIGTASIGGRWLDHFLIKCEKCGVKTKAYLTEKGVYKSWNRRVSNDDNNASKDCEDEVVHCIDCEYLMFADCYGECAKAYKGIVRPNDFCGKGVLKMKKSSSNIISHFP